MKRAETAATGEKSQTKGAGGFVGPGGAHEATGPSLSAPAYLATMDEKSFQRTVVAAAETLGWLCFHWPRAIGNPIWPDLTLIRDGETRYAELKTERGRLGSRQEERIEQLRAAGCTVYVWRPSAWSEIVRALGAEAMGDG